MKGKRGPNHKFDRELLIKKVAEMRIEGKSTPFILDFLQNQIGYCYSTAYEIIREVQKYITTIQDKKVEDAYTDSISRLERLYESTTDKKTRLQIQQELNKLQGLYKPNRVDITTNGKDMIPSEVVIKIVGGESDEGE